MKQKARREGKIHPIKQFQRISRRDKKAFFQ